MRIAVVRNRSVDGVVARSPKPSPEKYGRSTIAAVVESLESRGHDVALLEGDRTLFDALEAFMPADPETGRPTGIVLNLAYGIQGDCRYTHVPAMLEMAGIPYTGADPLGHAVCLDKVTTKVVMTAAGIPTPAFRVMYAPGPADGLRFPVVVKPRHESTSFGLHLVERPEDLDAAVADVIARYRQDALVEEYIDGREVCVAILGDDPAVALPPVEIDFSGRALRMNTYGDKFHKTADEPEKICPAPLPADLLREVEQIALATHAACGARDYSRVDMRIDAEGRPYVLEINSMASLGAGGSYVRAAQEAGLTYASLVERIVRGAWERNAEILGPWRRPLRVVIGA